MRAALRLAAVTGVALLFGCGAAAVEGRFKDQPIVWQVDDSQTIPEPTARRFFGLFYFADGMIFDPVVDALRPPDKQPAQNTNALDEVPDSNWFVNRVGVREVSALEAARGPDINGPPRLPVVVVKAKAGGANPGFIIKDARGIGYLVKFDTRNNPEQQTANNVIVNRIFWTLGYYVPADHVFFFQRDQLAIDAELEASGKVNHQLIDRMLTAATRRSDDAYRATASEFLSGVAKGGYASTGTRPGDINDRVPHQYRRELRGLRVFAAWLGHTDVKEDNSLDMYIEEDGRRFLRHYLVDFGEALGGHQSEKDIIQIGWEHAWDYAAQLRALVSFGFWCRPWEGQVETPWKSVGYFSAAQFAPRQWRGRYPYQPFFHVDAADEYWAARLVMRFTTPMLAAIVARGELSESAAAAYLVDTLARRRDKIGAAFLDGVTPLDELRFEAGKLCATDLTRKYGFATSGVVEEQGSAGKVVARHVESSGGRVCIPIAADEQYRVLRLRIRRTGKTTRPMQIHYKGGARPRLLGLVRIEY